MLSTHARSTLPSRPYATVPGSRRLPHVHPGDLVSFREQAFRIERPVLLPRNAEQDVPAIHRWFRCATSQGTALNTDYLEQHGSIIVPLEISALGPSSSEFSRVERPLSDFLQMVKLEAGQVAPHQRATQVYLAQCPLSTLPLNLQADLITPELVLKAGKGDVYDSSIWIGRAPTYTPLHRDPNPNFFLQLAGEKVVQLFEPAIGRELFSAAQARAGTSRPAALRGEEMMQGREKEVLEEMVWSPTGLVQTRSDLGFEASLQAGDALFIPKGWWHSIKGVGQGMVGSVNWWFR